MTIAVSEVTIRNGVRLKLTYVIDDDRNRARVCHVAIIPENSIAAQGLAPVTWWQ